MPKAKKTSIIFFVQIAEASWKKVKTIALIADIIFERSIKGKE